MGTDGLDILLVDVICSTTTAASLSREVPLSILNDDVSCFL
jgi:hypothetical protein